MEKFWVLILVAFFATNSLDNAESVQLEEFPLETFDEIFGEGWWDKDKAKEWHKLTLEQNALHQIDQQNTQIGQIEPNSTEQNSPLIESDHFDNAKNGEKQDKITKEFTSNKNNAKDERKHKIIDKFNAMKEEFKQKGKYSAKEWTKIENEISTNLGVNRKKIYEWKKELDLSRRNPKEERKHLVEKFDQMKAELKRAGFKNSYHNEINEIVAKKLGLGFITIYKWKRKLGQTKPNKHSHSEQKELIKRYHAIKDQNPKISDEKIVKMLKIGTVTLYKWKKQFKQQQFHPNSVDGHSVEENAAANVQDSEKN